MSNASVTRVSPVVVVGFAAALVAAIMVGGAGPAYRLKLLPLGESFGVLQWGAWLGLGAVLVALIGGWLARSSGRRRGFFLMWAGVVLGGIAFGIPFVMLQGANKVPPIHDISTDTENPPRFVAVLPLRAGAANPVEYEGEAIAKQQRTAYPDIQSLNVAEPPLAAFQRALTAARNLGWEIVAAMPNEGRIEATDTTIWFGFKDDIVVRVVPAGGGSRVDVRSVSRLGESDLGKNAERVRAYLQRLRGETPNSSSGSSY
jgi:uncharacterized protein (DUF1499 family)